MMASFLRTSHNLIKINGKMNKIRIGIQINCVSIKMKNKMSQKMWRSKTRSLRSFGMKIWKILKIINKISLGNSFI